MRIVNNFEYGCPKIRYSQRLAKNNERQSEYKTNIQNINQYYLPTFKMKMGDLKGIDQWVAKNYGINPQGFKTLNDFQKHCKKLAYNIKITDFPGLYKETKQNRKKIIDKWYNYILNENLVYTGAIALMIMKGITSCLKANNDIFPPDFNAGALADTIQQIKDRIPQDPQKEEPIHFRDEYCQNYQNILMSEERSIDESLNGWIEIPSYKKDSANFEANVSKLRALSHPNWCTKSLMAEPYLKEGDFHVYMEHGKPKLGVRFVGDEIKEIQGKNNNSKIPVKYGDIVVEHIKDFKLSNNAEYELKILQRSMTEIKKIKSKFPNGIENASTEEILEGLGINFKKDSDGLLIISHYGTKKPDKFYVSHPEKSEPKFSYSDLGIDENKLFKDIKAIEGDACFSYSAVTNLGNLQRIGGNAIFIDSKVKDLGKLEEICGNANFKKSEITNLSNLQIIGGDAWFTDSIVNDLGNLRKIGGNAHFDKSKITDLGNLEEICGDAWFTGSEVLTLGKLRKIGGQAWFHMSKVEDLGELEEIGGNALFSYNNKITTLGKLRLIGGDAVFNNSVITDLGELREIHGKVYIVDSPLKPDDFASIIVRGEIVSD